MRGADDRRHAHGRKAAQQIGVLTSLSHLSVQAGGNVAGRFCSRNEPPQCSGIPSGHGRPPLGRSAHWAGPLRNRDSYDDASSFAALYLRFRRPDIETHHVDATCNEIYDHRRSTPIGRMGDVEALVILDEFRMEVGWAPSPGDP